VGPASVQFAAVLQSLPGMIRFMNSSNSGTVAHRAPQGLAAKRRSPYAVPTGGQPRQEQTIDSVKTLRLPADPENLHTPAALDALDRAGRILVSGGLVALPTETVYGLGANALDHDAVARIFAAKKRPSWDPVIVHVSTVVMAEALVSSIPSAARSLMHAFWPGPLTLLLPRGASIPDEVTAGRPLVGLRMPAHPVALALIRHTGLPIAAPSANLFGHTSPTTADHVLRDLDGRIDAILDAGPTRHGLESTVLDPTQSPMIIYRPGAITAEQIQAVGGPVVQYKLNRETAEIPPEGLPAPGVGMRHYAPAAPLVLVDAPLAELGRRLAAAARLLAGERIGVMLPAGVAAPHGAVCFSWGRWAALEDLARSLYAGLRSLDSQGCTIILCPVPPPEGIGIAIRDRLFKAAKSA
jgi:L-threonylcarbamoyladenylate synthase